MCKSGDVAVKLSKLTFLGTLTLLATISLATVARAAGGHGESGGHGDPNEHDGATFVGSLWIVGNSSSQSATFPVPAQTPDAVFLTTSAAFFSDAPPPLGGVAYSTPYGDNTIAGFLGSASNLAALTFSGLVNPILGVPVTSGTALANGTPTSPSTYGILVELTGYANLNHNDYITVWHDAGVSVRIDGADVHGITSTGGLSSAISESFRFTGSSGKHVVDIVYSNFAGQGVLAFSSDLQLGGAGQCEHQ